MQHSDRFDVLRSELAQSGSLNTAKVRAELLSETKPVEDLVKELASRSSTGLSNIQLRNHDSLEWSLICNSGYKIGPTNATKPPKALCCVVVSETAEEVLDSRTHLLRFENAMSLRESLWLDVNQWLTWNPSGLFVSSPARPQFQYWDEIPGQPLFKFELYRGEKAQRIHQLLHNDIKRLVALGDFLTSCSALSNNPDSAIKDRVISSEMKDAISSLLLVRRFNCLAAESTTDSTFQVAANRMDQQRLLTCPPDEAEEDEERQNMFLTLPLYRYSQPTFKTFSEDEIRGQAGKESLPKEIKAEFQEADNPPAKSGEQAEGDQESSVNKDGQPRGRRGHSEVGKKYPTKHQRSSSGESRGRDNSLSRNTDQTSGRDSSSAGKQEQRRRDAPLFKTPPSAQPPRRYTSPPDGSQQKVLGVSRNIDRANTLKRRRGSSNISQDGEWYCDHDRGSY